MTDPPLSGIRVLDLSRLLPGGFCSLLLSDYGAEVLKVEDTGAGDYLRWWQPNVDGAEESAAGAAFIAVNRGKRSIRIDLKSETGRELMLDLAAEHDVLLESFRPGVLDRLGLGYERLRERNPALVHCAISSYGQSGPRSQLSAHDLNIIGISGALALTGEGEGPPVQPAVQVADVGGGSLMAAFGIMAALRERERSGEGQFVDISMARGTIAWLATEAAQYLAGGGEPERGAGLSFGGVICYRPYECAEGWVTLGALEEKFWRAWCVGVGRQDLVANQFDPPGSPAQAEVEAIFSGRSREQWLAFASEHDCCLEPLLGLGEALESELAVDGGPLVELEQPGASAPVRVLGLPFGLSRTPGDPVRRPAPALGEHTEEVLRLMGHDDSAIAALLASGTVAGRTPGSGSSFLR